MSGLVCAVPSGLSASLHDFSNCWLNPSNTHAANATTSSGRFARSKNPAMTSLFVAGTEFARYVA